MFGDEEVLAKGAWKMALLLLYCGLIQAIKIWLIELVKIIEIILNTQKKIIDQLIKLEHLKHLAANYHV